MNESKWKVRYEDLLRKHENEREANAELEELLTRTIIRLTIAANGLDKRLDPYLKSVRDAVRGGRGKNLSDQLNAFSDSLLHFAEDQCKNEPAVDPDTLAKHVEPLQLSKKELAEVTSLMTRLVDDPSDLSQDEFQRFATLLGQGVGLKADRRPGLFDRLLGGAADSGDDSPRPNEILLNLLEQAAWPGHWGESISALKVRLIGKAADDAWIGVLEDLLELSAKSYGEVQMEIKEAEDFLTELTRRLQDFGTHLQNIHDGRDKIVEHGRRLSVEMNGQMGDLGHTVRQATDLHQLKNAVSERLSQIQTVVDDYLVEESHWHEQTEEREKALKDRLTQLESESSELHTRMVEAHHLALIDAVTGLPNRMAYDERATQEYARWKRFNEPLTMLVWDIDDFKSINDRFGHQAGDKALKVIARSLNSRLRVTDFIARYGGEEFVCLLCGSSGDEALHVAEEMRKSVAENGFHSSGNPVHVTISCGLTSFVEGDTLNTVFSRADKALYQAKKAGKNRCVLG
ncbi:MAG: GGDEF domain-containing protein [Candidatus Thiodiazotropha sp.]